MVSENCADNTLFVQKIPDGFLKKQARGLWPASIDRHPFTMQINTLKLDTPFILAPLAGYTDLAFRILCRQYGAGLCYSEMISCHGLVYQQANTLAMIRTVPEERPVAFQLFGSDPEVMGEAAAILSEQPIDLIDINMGCPVRKVTKRGAGAALMREPALADRIIRRVVACSKVPVTVKIRSGWDHHSIVATDFARMAEEAGAQAIAVHARTWSDGFSGKPDWQVISSVKKAVSIPVIGNGDITSHAGGLAMINETGCDGVMIGRGALGAPWIFQDTGDGEPSLSLRFEALQKHLELIRRHHAPERILAKTKNHAGRYFKGVSGGASIRQRIYRTSTFQELQELTIPLSRINSPSALDTLTT